MQQMSRLPSWWIAGGVAAFGLIQMIRAKGYRKLAPDLRTPAFWVRTPSLSGLSLPIARKAGAMATACVDGVALEEIGCMAADGASLRMFIYRPTHRPAGSGAIFYTHCGGMITVSAANYHARLSAYARDLQSCIVTVDYRLAPEHPFPTPLDDVHSAYLWLVENAVSLGLDPARILVAGESAGGGLTTALCQRLLDHGQQMPTRQVLIYPMLDDRTTLRKVAGHVGELVWTRGSNRFAWTCYLGRPPRWDCAPAYAAPARRTDLSGLPPTWIGVGTLDLFLMKTSTMPCA